MKNLLILGGSVAGLTCALTIVANNQNYKITVLEQSSQLARQIAGVPQIISKKCKLTDTFFTTEQYLISQNIQIQLNCTVTSVNYTSQTVKTSSGEFSYDKLIIATGTIQKQNFTPENEFCYRNLQHLKSLEETKISSILVLGGGITGVEIAAAFAEIRTKVTIITENSYLCDENYDLDYARQIEKILTQNNVEIHFESKILSLKDVKNQVTAVTSQGSFTAEKYVNCTGIIPNSELFSELKRSSDGAILVDKNQVTSNENVYAIGDVASVVCNFTKKQVFAPSGQLSAKSAISCASHLNGKSLPLQGTQFTKIFKIFGYFFCSVGRPLHMQVSQSAKRVKLSDNHRAEFMPTFEVVSLQMTYDDTSRQILGAQVFSKHDISPIGNAISLGIQRDLKVEEMMVMDFFFQPHFGKPWHIINLACMATIGLPPFEQYKIRAEGQQEIE